MKAMQLAEYLNCPRRTALEAIALPSQDRPASRALRRRLQSRNILRQAAPSLCWPSFNGHAVQPTALPPHKHAALALDAKHSEWVRRSRDTNLQRLNRRHSRVV